MARDVFISHSDEDASVIDEIETALTDAGATVWTEARGLTDASELEPEVRTAIEGARLFVPVLSIGAMACRWVAKEIQYALQVKRQGQSHDDLKVIPIVLDPVNPNALHLWFGEEPAPLAVRIDPSGVAAALPPLLRALGMQAGREEEGSSSADAGAIAAPLTLTLREITRDEGDGAEGQITAMATLRFQPPDGGRPVESPTFRFTLPRPPVAAAELAWYLERFGRWPSAATRARSEQIELQLPLWGQRLATALASAAGGPTFEAWQKVAGDAVRHLTVTAVPRGDKDAAAALLALPWELLPGAADGTYLFDAPCGLRVRRTVPHRGQRPVHAGEPPLRVLVVSPRPSRDDAAEHVDHRAVPRPLVQALTALGELTVVSVLGPPTLEALQEMLAAASTANTPYHLLCFDGFGLASGRLIFEAPAGAEDRAGRRGTLVAAKTLADLCQAHRVPLVLLAACRAHDGGRNPTTAVASALLECGVPAIAALGHVLPAARLRTFLGAFCAALLGGDAVAPALVAGQRALKEDRAAAVASGAGQKDWFVPLLFHGDNDPQLITGVAPERLRREMQRRRVRSFGELPPVPEHGFVGRSRELLAAERWLEKERHVVLWGLPGAGKTVLAAELARWLVISGRAQRAVYVPLEVYSDARAVQHAIGQQLVPKYMLAASLDPRLAVQLVDRVLAEQSIVVVIDNLEAVMAPVVHIPATAEMQVVEMPFAETLAAETSAAETLAAETLAAEIHEPQILAQILTTLNEIARLGKTRLILASNAPLPRPFDRPEVEVAALTRGDAVTLLGRAVARRGPTSVEAVEDEAEVEALIDVVHQRPRSLVLLADDIAAGGLVRTTERLVASLTPFWQSPPAGGEPAVLVGVNISLGHLPAARRAVIRPLGAFHGGGHLTAIATALGLDIESDEDVALAEQLIGVGLAEMLPHNYVRLHPALTAVLRHELEEEGLAAAQEAWAEAMRQLVGFLYQQQVRDPSMASTLTLLELPNLLATLHYMEKRVPPDRVVKVATSVERLVEVLGRPKALAAVVKIRTTASERLGEWGAERFRTELAAVKQQMASGRHKEAVTGAEVLLERAEAAGEAAYEEASYDLARAYLMRGRALLFNEEATQALEPLEEAVRRFETLSGRGVGEAARMLAVAGARAGDCLLALGRWDAASRRYEQAIDAFRRLGDREQLAAVKVQLGTVRLHENQRGPALAVFTQAREIFESLGAEQTVAATWQKIAAVHLRGKNYEAASQAFEAALRIELETGNRAGAAATLTELGNVYDSMGQVEEAVAAYRRAAERFAEVEDLGKEGIARSIIADRLIKEHRFDEARQELLRAIECDRPFGHEAEPWSTFSRLSNLERTVGNEAAAKEARERAVLAYLDYRRAGGGNRSGHGPIFAEVAHAIESGELRATEAQLSGMLRREDLPRHLKALIPALRTLLQGGRDPALAADPELYYRDAAELVLLLQSLESAPQTGAGA